MYQGKQVWCWLSSQRISLTCFPCFLNKGLCSSLCLAISPLSLFPKAMLAFVLSLGQQKSPGQFTNLPLLWRPQVYFKRTRILCDCLLLTLYRWEPPLCITPALLLKLFWYSTNHSLLNNTGLNPYCDAQNHLQGFWSPLLQLQSRIVGCCTPCQKYVCTELFAEETQRRMEKCSTQEW